MTGAVGTTDKTLFVDDEKESPYPGDMLAAAYQAGWAVLAETDQSAGALIRKPLSDKLSQGKGRA